MSVTGKQPDGIDRAKMDRPKASALDLTAIRERLASTSGRAYWRGLDELASTPEFQEFLYREFPRQASAWTEGMSRRTFLTLAGAALGLAGLSGCQPHLPDEPIVPYVDQPDGLIPGLPLFFSTAMIHDGYAHPIVVTSREGRPIKIEGNPDHPASLGATDAITQASLLSLYDPDRSQGVLRNGLPDTYDSCLAALVQQMQAEAGRLGAGLRLVTGRITSPTLLSQIERLMARYPQARWCQHEPIERDNERAGALLAFGADVQPLYHFDRAQVVLALDADFLLTMPGHVRYAADFASQRRVRKDNTRRNRLYVVESTPSITGAVADNRLALRPSAIESLARAIAADVTPGATPTIPLDTAWMPWAQAVGADLIAHTGACLVVVGERQPPAVHALAHAMNAALGNVGVTVTYTHPIEGHPNTAMRLPELAAEIRSGQVQTLVILDSNPAYTAPADLAFADVLSKAPFSLHLGGYVDETAAACAWHVPQTHTLEAWGDALAYDGTPTILQPLIAPLYATHTAFEIVAALSGQIARSDHDIVRDYWRAQPSVQSSTGQQPTGQQPTEQQADRDFEAFWRKSLNDGFVSIAQPTLLKPPLLASATSSAATPAIPSQGKEVSDPTPNAQRLTPGLPPSTLNAQRSTLSGETPNAQRLTPNAPLSGILDIVFAPDPTIWDGRYANNAWLQELPKPLNKLTWDNAALISPATAERLRLANNDEVTLRYRGRSVTATLWVLPGQPEDVITAHLGYGRTRAGRVGSGTGFNAYALRTSDAPWFGTGVEILKTGGKRDLACTHSHWTMDGRDIVRTGTLAQFRDNPAFVHKLDTEPDPPPTLYPDWHYPEYAWAMSIDLNTCIGCNACVVACQSENNIPSVGKAEVLRGREMHWIRIDRYYEGKNIDAPDATYFMPVPCMHCEHAPCELVCPVGATLHNRDGLNQMVYNRCVGTRYCSNNCPYKVRRFNFLHYTAQPPSNYEGPLLSLMCKHQKSAQTCLANRLTSGCGEGTSSCLMQNPEVTVRSRGVMEKCTYCVQRIENAKIGADKENRLVRDGEITTACAQACPTSAITFGNLADRESAVSKLKREPHDYGLLAELDTRPRTTYLARITDPNPAARME